MTGTVLDLFCGCGGFTLGFEQAGYDVIAGVDKDEVALETYERNFDHEAIECNLAETEPETFADEYGICPEDVDVVIGGPPCQGFSRANIDRSLDDGRCNLVFIFADYVNFYEPDVFLMENVKGIQTGERKELFQRLLGDFRTYGYSVDWKVLNAADYGVPQTRERVFVQGRDDGELTWPDSTHAPKEEVLRYEGSGAEMVSSDD